METLITLLLASAQFRPIEVAALEKRQRHLKNPGLASLKFEFLSTLRRGTAFPDLSLGLSNFSSLPNHNPSPTFGTGHARARNAIGHAAIILRHRRRLLRYWPRPEFIGLQKFFASICILGGEPSGRLPNLQYQGRRHDVAVGCDHRE